MSYIDDSLSEEMRMGMTMTTTTAMTTIMAWPTNYYSHNSTTINDDNEVKQGHQ